MTTEAPGTVMAEFPAPELVVPVLAVTPLLNVAEPAFDLAGVAITVDVLRLPATVVAPNTVSVSFYQRTLRLLQF
jgi:hypothetical protein